MKRTLPIKYFLTAGVLALFLTACDKSAPKTSRAPNVIIIYTDDQGTIDANCYGAKDLYTPNMDRLAETGVRFTQFYAAAPICSPSRAALLTGKTPLAAGLPGKYIFKKRKTRFTIRTSHDSGKIKRKRIRYRPCREMAPGVLRRNDAQQSGV